MSAKSMAAMKYLYVLTLQLNNEIIHKVGVADNVDGRLLSLGAVNYTKSVAAWLVPRPVAYRAENEVLKKTVKYAIMPDDIPWNWENNLEYRRLPLHMLIRLCNIAIGRTHNYNDARTLADLEIMETAPICMAILMAESDIQCMGTIAISTQQAFKDAKYAAGAAYRQGALPH